MEFFLPFFILYGGYDPPRKLTPQFHEKTTAYAPILPIFPSPLHALPIHAQHPPEWSNSFILATFIEPFTYPHTFSLSFTYPLCFSLLEIER